jgi:serine/threonine protein kinase
MAGACGPSAACPGAYPGDASCTEGSVVEGLHCSYMISWHATVQVTHGDMKAQNVLITGRWAKITDVGVARVMTAPEQLAPEVTLGT